MKNRTMIINLNMWSYTNSSPAHHSPNGIAIWILCSLFPDVKWHEALIYVVLKKWMQRYIDKSIAIKYTVCVLSLFCFYFIIINL